MVLCSGISPGNAQEIIWGAKIDPWTGTCNASALLTVSSCQWLLSPNFSSFLSDYLLIWMGQNYATKSNKANIFTQPTDFISVIAKTDCEERNEDLGRAIDIACS